MASRRHIFVACALVAVGISLVPSAAFGAELYFDPASGRYPPGVTFSVDVRLNTQGECVNAADVEIAYPKDSLEAVDTSEGDSLFSLWIKRPTIYPDYGLVSMVGGIPGGYCGRAPGDPGLSNKIATLIFRFPTSTQAAQAPVNPQISFINGSRVSLNDGLGTDADLNLSSAKFAVITKGQFLPQNTWLAQLQADSVPPDPFTVGVYKDNSIFEGKYFAVFSTVDKQTGIDHYEVAEVPASDMGLPDYKLNWTRAVSPYLIKDQNLDGALKVKAIDKAGNETIAAYVYPKAPPPHTWYVSVFSYLAIVGLIALGIIRIAIRFVL